MLRNYIIKSSPITVFFPDDAWDFFTPGKDIDVIDLGILNHIHRLPAFLTTTLDGPSQLVVEQADNTLFFEFSTREFLDCNPLFEVNTKYTSTDSQNVDIENRLNKLVENGLLLSIKSKEFPEITLYRTSELYEELFVC